MRAVAAIMGTVGAAILTSVPAPTRADDPARRACYADATRLCSSEVHSLSRRRVEICLASHVNQTTPTCHAMIETIRAQRATAASRAPVAR